MFILITLVVSINLLGMVACRSIAKSRGSRHVGFWTGMGILFGPVMVPIVLIFTQTYD